ncbi:preprotein translocase subunit SecE [Dellaglioa sp. BT-FLS60]
MRKINAFLKSVIVEIKATTWPTGKELRRDTTTVVVTAILFAIFFWIVDSGASAFVSLFS